LARIAILVSHPIQYYAPLFRQLAEDVDLMVFFAHRPTAKEQAAGFGTSFDWDVDLTDGFPHIFLENGARRPGSDHFAGCDTPEIGQRLLEGRFEGLLTMGWHLKSYVQGLFAAKRLGLPVMVRGDSHLDTPRSLQKRWGKAIIYPAFLRLFDAALYVGARNYAYYIHYKYPKNRLFFSPHCVDIERFVAHATLDARKSLRVELGIADDAFVVLFAGKFQPLKRPLDILRAAAKCRADGCTVEVAMAGGGELENQIVGESRRLGVPLHRLGFRNQTQMPAAYAAADCLVLSSESETWGLVVNEALACGRPVIVSDACGCAPDLAADGLVGRVFPIGDVEALAAAIAKVKRFPPSPRAISKLAERYSVARAVNGISEAIESVKRGG
jgi:glycosyltransferase involved in cell wall biosynthesis